MNRFTKFCSTEDILYLTESSFQRASWGFHALDHQQARKTYYYARDDISPLKSLETRRSTRVVNREFADVTEKYSIACDIHASNGAPKPTGVLRGMCCGFPMLAPPPTRRTWAILQRPSDVGRPVTALHHTTSSKAPHTASPSPLCWRYPSSMASPFQLHLSPPSPSR